MEDFYLDPVGPFYTGLGAHLGDASVTYIPIDNSNVPLNINRVTQTTTEIPLVPILLLGGLIIYLWLNR